MPLITQLREFIAWLQAHALEGFRDFSEDFYDTDNTYEIASEVLAEYGSQMKRCVEYNDQINFDRARAEYLRLFDKVNEAIAKQLFADAQDKYLDKNHENSDAERYALEEVWENPKARYYLNAHAILKHQDGREVFLIANERHIPQGNLYVLTTELKDITRSGLDPWEYVTTRKA